MFQALGCTFQTLKRISQGLKCTSQGLEYKNKNDGRGFYQMFLENVS